MLKGQYSSGIPSDRQPSLGGLCFGAQCPPQMRDEQLATYAHIAMPCLDGATLWCERFETEGPIKLGRLGQVRYRFNEDLLFGVVQLREEEFASQPHVSPLQNATRAAYEQVFAVLAATGHSHVYRFWNYMADINAQSHDLERYRQFNLGRQQAFAARGQALTGNVPAACALGSSQGPLTVGFLAGRRLSMPIENPRQVSAYHYPPQYGPSSPLFSRASLAHIGRCEVLFISGTASILGHQTLHGGDLRAQTLETVANLEAVVTQANSSLGRPRFNLKDLHYQVYVRHAADFDAVRTLLNERISPEIKAVYVQADICRHDLLLEIEAIGGFAP